MLVEFSIENFRSFKDRETLSLIAAKLRSRNERLDNLNVITVDDKLELLRSAVIYGANASGKSNIVLAFGLMCNFVTQSISQHDNAIYLAEPFMLNTENRDQPSTFEVVFIQDGLQYRYGFCVTYQRVDREWLFYTPTIREARLFTRDADGIILGDRFNEGKKYAEDVQDNQLFLSSVAQFKRGNVSRLVRNWFATVGTLSAGDDSRTMQHTMDCIESGTNVNHIQNLVRQLDLDVTRLSVVEVPKWLSLAALPSSALPPQGTNGATESEVRRSADRRAARTVLRTHHLVRGSENTQNEQGFNADAMESAGTLRLIALAGPITEVLANGMVLFVDELDLRLHPLITAAIIRMFNSPVTNPNNAQLVCTTHDTNLLDRDQLRRDQIYFVEKDSTSSSHLYSLADFKIESPDGKGRTERNDAHFEKNYIQGRYGAIPYLGDLSHPIMDDSRVGEQITDRNELTDKVTA